MKKKEIITDREYKILILNFGFGVDKKINLQKIGEKVGLSESRICQIKNGALRKIQNYLKSYPEEEMKLKEVWRD